MAVDILAAQGGQNAKYRLQQKRRNPELQRPSGMASSLSYGRFGKTPTFGPLPRTSILPAPPPTLPALSPQLFPFCSCGGLTSCIWCFWNISRICFFVLNKNQFVEGAGGGAKCEVRKDGDSVSASDAKSEMRTVCLSRRVQGVL